MRLGGRKCRSSDIVDVLLSCIWDVVQAFEYGGKKVLKITGSELGQLPVWPDIKLN